MNTNELLQELAYKINAHEISRREVAEYLDVATGTYEQGISAAPLPQVSTNYSLTKIMYIIGATIVSFGIIAFVGQIWGDISSIGRILVTLGLGLLCAGLGSALLVQKPEETIGAVFHTIGGLLIPFGVGVVFNELGFYDAPWLLAFVFAGLSASYVLLTVVHRNAVLTFFAIANITLTAYLFLNAIVGGPNQGWFGIKDIYVYLTMLIGGSYLLLGYSYKETWNSKLVWALYFFGTLGILGFGFAKVFDSALWELFYPLLVIGGLFLAVYLKSRTVLVLSTLCLIGYISYVTAEYFADSLGWPISLVLMGFAFIALGYFSVNLSRRYIAN